jgi:hypothetical protein
VFLSVLLLEEKRVKRGKNRAKKANTEKSKLKQTENNGKQWKAMESKNESK